MQTGEEPFPQKGSSPETSGYQHAFVSSILSEIKCYLFFIYFYFSLRDELFGARAFYNPAAPRDAIGIRGSALDLQAFEEGLACASTG